MIQMKLLTDENIQDIFKRTYTLDKVVIKVGRVLGYTLLHNG